MNDRFKFRVWNKENKKLYDWDFLEKTKEENTFFWVMHQAQNDCKHNILMQCTGLKDKNGKLIYEGDFLRYPATETYYANHFMFCEVFWHNNDCCDNHIGWQMNRYHNVGGLMEINFGTKYKFMPKNTEKMEIIGNIYENKDLLNENS